MLTHGRDECAASCNEAARECQPPSDCGLTRLRPMRPLLLGRELAFLAVRMGSPERGRVGGPEQAGCTRQKKDAGSDPEVAAARRGPAPGQVPERKRDEAQEN